MAEGLTVPDTGQEYVACDRSGYRYQVNAAQPDPHYIYVTDLTDGSRRKVQPAALHTDPQRRTGYLLASLATGPDWENDPRARSAMYRTQVDRTTSK